MGRTDSSSRPIRFCHSRKAPSSRTGVEIGILITVVPRPICVVEKGMSMADSFRLKNNTDGGIMGGQSIAPLEGRFIQGGLTPKVVSAAPAVRNRRLPGRTAQFV